MDNNKQVLICCADGCINVRKNFTFYCDKCHREILKGKRLKNKLWSKEKSNDTRTN